jgi:hypothetical protein
MKSTYDIKTECLEYHHCVAAYLAYIPDSKETLSHQRCQYVVSPRHDQVHVLLPTVD